jgi:hypothetical protein
MAALVFLLARVAEREQYWSAEAASDPGLESVAAHQLALCAEDRRRIAKTDPRHPSRHVEHMLLAYRDHAEFDRSWPPDL